MKVLHIMAGRGQGGAETYSTDIMLSLHKEGVDEICVVAPDAPRTQEMRETGVPLATDVLKCKLRFIQRRRLKKLIEQEKPDLIHCWMRRAASLLPEGINCPVIGWFGGYYDPKNFARCTQFVGVTQGIADHMVEKGVHKDSAHYVPTFPTIKEEVPTDRASLDTPTDAPVILTLSRLHQKKGLDTLLDAVATIPNAYVWLAGEGPLRRQLEKQVKKLGLEERVRFLGWRTNRGALLAAADICVLPSRYEPFGTVILEAWAAKTPFVAAASAGPAAHIRDGENGMLVPIDNDKALAIALDRVIKDRALCKKIITAGFETYSRHFTREAVTAQMVKLYEEMVAGNKTH